MATFDEFKAKLDKLQADLAAFLAAQGQGATPAQLDELGAEVDAMDATVQPPTT